MVDCLSVGNRSIGNSQQVSQSVSGRLEASSQSVSETCQSVSQSVSGRSMASE